MSSDAQVLEQGWRLHDGDQSLVAGCGRYQQSYPNNQSACLCLLLTSGTPFAYEVEPPIPLVLHAEKYSQR